MIQRWTALLFAFMAVLNICAGVKKPAEAESSAGGSLSLLAIIVNKADALLLRSGETAYLIDTGSKNSFDALYRALTDEGVTRLDGVILTHTHSDHAGGLKKLLASDIQVDQDIQIITEPL